MDYVLLKMIHRTAVALSGTGFVARGLGGLMGAAWVRGRAARTLPHGVDTALLLSALGLVWTLHLSPGAAPWLVAKIVGLLLYIALGVVALRGSRPVVVRAIAFAAALATFGWIVSVAITKNAFGLLGML